MKANNTKCWNTASFMFKISHTN